MMRVSAALALGVILVGVALPGVAVAGDVVDTDHDWAGFYAGVAVNAVGAGLDVRGAGSDADIENNAITFTALAGYNFTSGPLVLGVESEIGNAGFGDGAAIVGLGAVTGDADWNSAVALRAGWAFDDLLIYAKVGVAFTDLDLSSTAGGRLSDTLMGGVLGAGMEYAVNDTWSVRGELSAYGFSDKAVLGGADRKFDLGEGMARIGVAMHF